MTYATRWPSQAPAWFKRLPPSWRARLAQDLLLLGLKPGRLAIKAILAEISDADLVDMVPELNTLFGALDTGWGSEETTALILDLWSARRGRPDAPISPDMRSVMNAMRAHVRGW